MAVGWHSARPNRNRCIGYHVVQRYGVSDKCRSLRGSDPSNQGKGVHIQHHLSEIGNVREGNVIEVVNNWINVSVDCSNSCIKLRLCYDTMSGLLCKSKKEKSMVVVYRSAIRVCNCSASRSQSNNHNMTVSSLCVSNANPNQVLLAHYTWQNDGE